MAEATCCLKRHELPTAPLYPRGPRLPCSAAYPRPRGAGQEPDKRRDRLKRPKAYQTTEKMRQRPPSGAPSCPGPPFWASFLLPSTHLHGTPSFQDFSTLGNPRFASPGPVFFGIPFPKLPKTLPLPGPYPSGTFTLSGLLSPPPPWDPCSLWGSRTQYPLPSSPCPQPTYKGWTCGNIFPAQLQPSHLPLLRN